MDGVGLHTGPARRRALFTAYLLVLFVVSFCIGALHDDYPLGFHPDEPSKVRQIRTGDFNFFHPQLMLSLTRAAVAVEGADDPQRIVELGRLVSATLGAGAVVALALAVALMFGYLPAVLTGILLLQSYPLLTTMHYMKEDTALVFGMAVTMAAIAWFWQRPDKWRCAALGAAVALAVSGKYIGVVMVPAALFVFFIHPDIRARATRRRELLHMLGAFALVVLLFNGAALFQPSSAVRGLGREVVHSVSGHEGTAANPLDFFYLRMLGHELSWPVIVAAAFGVLMFALTWRRLNWPQRLFLIVPVGYMLIISFAPLQSVRYLLPTVVWMSPIAALGIVWSVDHAARHASARAAAAVVAAALVAVPGALRCWDYEYQFANDSRTRLAEWMMQNLDASTRVVQDKHAALDRAANDKLHFAVVTENPAVALGSPEELAAQGFTHIVVCEPTYRRYFSRHVKSTDQFADEYNKIRARYQRIWNECELVWESRPGRDMGAFTNPQVRLYRLPHPAGDIASTESISLGDIASGPLQP